MLQVSRASSQQSRLWLEASELVKVQVKCGFLALMHVVTGLRPVDPDV